MAKKGKQVLWHKKRGKMTSVSSLGIHAKQPDPSKTVPLSGNKLKDFARKLSAQIKEAARDR